MRHKLEFDDEFNFLLFGISSNGKDYRLAWAINKNLNLHLKRAEDIITGEHKALTNGEDKGGRSFSLFTFHDALNHIKYFLVSNKSEGKVFSKELRQMDYLLIAEGNYEYVDVENFLLKLKNSETVLAAYQINSEVLKAKQHLLFG